MPVALLGVAAAATAFGAVETYRASRSAASVDNATAAYNARYDQSMAQQLDLDTLQNVRTERQNDAVYLSRQAASYAAAGVLATTGSPLHAQITNAGRMEQQIQQQYVNSQQKQLQYYAAAKVGVLEGQANAAADRMSGSIALINGVSKIAGMAYAGYQGGLFGGGQDAESLSNIGTD